MDHTDSPKWIWHFFGYTNRYAFLIQRYFWNVICVNNYQDKTTGFNGACIEPAQTFRFSYNLTFGPSLVITQTGLVQQTPALAVWISGVRSKSPKVWKFLNVTPEEMVQTNNINLLITFFRRRCAEAFLLEHCSGAGSTGNPRGPRVPRGFRAESHGPPAGSGDTLTGSPRVRGTWRRRQGGANTCGLNLTPHTDHA